MPKYIATAVAMLKAMTTVPILRVRLICHHMKTPEMPHTTMAIAIASIAKVLGALGLLFRPLEGGAGIAQTAGCRLVAGREPRHILRRAGLVGFALLQLGATYMSGIEEVVRWSRFEDYVKGSDWLITGEGKFDAQSLEGKAPYGLARLAHTYGIPTLVFAGQSDLTAHEESGIVAIFPIVSRIMTLEEAIWEAAPLLTSAVQRVRHVLEKTL